MRMNTIERIKQLAKAHGWSEYRLAKETGLAASTIANIYHRGTVPTIPTLEILCGTFGISLGQFFSLEGASALPEEQQELMMHWTALTAEQREAFLRLMKSLK